MKLQAEFDRSQLEQLDQETLISRLLTLQEQVQQLQQVVAEQAAVIQSLRDQLAKDSHNCGKPPSSDGLPVFLYHDAFNPSYAEVDDLKERYHQGKVGDVEVKEKLARAINNFLEPIREKRAYFLVHPMIPRDVLANGIRRMQAEAKQSMELVREKTGLSYSLDLFADELDIFGNED